MKSLRKVIRAYKNYQRYRKTIAELSTLNDRELADIGITRGNIYDVAHGLVGRTL